MIILTYNGVVINCSTSQETIDRIIKQKCELIFEGKFIFEREVFKQTKVIFKI
jgi:hypothetical protein